jgi:hypothetical protein
VANGEMSELEILLEIHRAIDAAAAQSPEALAIAQRYIPGFRIEGAVGWTAESLPIVTGPDIPPEDLERELATLFKAVEPEDDQVEEQEKPARKRPKPSGKSEAAD